MSTKVPRRKFLQGAAVGGMATLVGGTAGASAQEAAQPKSATARMQPKDADPQALRPDVLTTDRPGSDFMIDVIKSLGFE